MEKVKQEIINYFELFNIEILDKLEKKLKDFKYIRENEINPYLIEVKKILTKNKLSKKNRESIISIINKLVLIISNIDNDKIKNIKEDFIKDSDYIISILKYGSRAIGIIINENEINETQIRNNLKKFTNELIKLQSFIEKNKEKILDFIEKEEIKNNDSKTNEIKKEKKRILKVILKYHKNIEKKIDKLVEIETNNLKLDKKLIKILIKIKEILIDYPIRFFFKSIKINGLINKNNENKYYKEVNEKLNEKYMKINEDLYKIKDNVEIYSIISNK